MTAEAPDRTEKPFEAKRIFRRYRFDVDSPPEQVFPLLCPVREREWIEGWKADVVFSQSGLAEKDCIFTSENALFGHALYVVTRHEPDPGRVESVVFFPGRCVMKLHIALEATPDGGTNLTWSRLYTGLSPEGNALLEQITEEVYQEQTKRLAQSLGRYCRELRLGRHGRPRRET